MSKVYHMTRRMAVLRAMRSAAAAHAAALRDRGQLELPAVLEHDPAQLHLPYAAVSPASGDHVPPLSSRGSEGQMAAPSPAPGSGGDGRPPSCKPPASHVSPPCALSDDDGGQAAQPERAGV